MILFKGGALNTKQFRSLQTFRNIQDKPNPKIIAFDLDGTIIKPKNGKRFPKDKDDYEYTFNNVDSKINELLVNGYKIVIFTNQNGIQKEKTNLINITYKIEKIESAAQIDELQTFVKFKDKILSIMDELMRFLQQE